MGKLVNVVYDATGNVVWLGFPPPPHADVQLESYPVALPGQTVGQFELPPEAVTARHAELSRLKIDTTAKPHRLSW